MSMPPGSPPPYGSPYGQPYGQGHGYPPPPPQPYSYPPGQYPLPPQKKSSSLKWLLIAGGVLVGVVLLVIGGAVAFYLIAGRNSVQATDVKVGDCLSELPDNSRVMFIKTVPCDQPHKGEVFTVLAMPDGSFPGDAAVSTYTDKCGPALAQYSPSASDNAAISLFVLYPTADSWKQGDRTVSCIATTSAPRTGKLG